MSDTPIEVFYRLKNSLEKKSDFVATKKTTTEYRYGDVKKIVSEDGSVEYMKKIPIRKYDVFDYDFRLSLAKEEMMMNGEANVGEGRCGCVRRKERTSFALPVGSLDLTIVHETINDTTNVKYEVELEIARGVSYDSLLPYIAFILQVRQNNVFVISNYEKREVVRQYAELLNQPRKPFFVGAQPETLRSNELSNLYKKPYSVTDKADGERAFMMVTTKKEVYFIDSNLNNIRKTNIVSTQNYACLVDGELVAKPSTVYFHAFDVLVYNSRDLRGDTAYDLRKRYELTTEIIKGITDAEDAEESDKGSYTVQTKEFIFNDVFLGAETLLEKAKDKNYKNDGLIFTPVDEPYPTVKKWPALLKWKPKELNTIDLFAVKNTNDLGYTVWTLFVQHQSNTPQPSSFQRPNVMRTERVPFDIAKLCPTAKTAQGVTFQTTFDDKLIDPTTEQPYQTNTVIEFQWDPAQSKFVPLRTRWDKTANPRKHGNFSAVACDIWNSIHNPVEKETLFKLTKLGKSSEDEHFGHMRVFHNKIKEYLYNKFTKRGDKLLELCSGRGGDINKWLHNNVQHVVGYDISQKSIDECERRLRSNTRPNSLTYAFHQMNLCDAGAPNTIRSQNPEQFDVVVCNFGVHYFFASRDSFQNLQDILAYSLKPGGKFVITFMDDVKLAELFKYDTVVERKVNDQVLVYMKRATKDSDAAFGNKLRVVLSGNNILSEGSDEYIINFKMFVGELAQMGFRVVETELFQTLDIPSARELTATEKTVSYLNRYAVFEKAESVLPVKNTLQTIAGEHQGELPKFEMSELHKNGLSVHKVSTKHEIIDVLNCMESRYNKNAIPNDSITTFQDIVRTFEQAKADVDYTAWFVTNPMDNSTFAPQDMRAINFTYYKHVIEKKDEQNQLQTLEYDNWYILLKDNAIVYKSLTVTEPTTATTVTEVTSELEALTVSEAPTTVPEAPTTTEASEAPTTVSEAPTTTEATVSDMTTTDSDSTETKKITVKILKEQLKSLGMKTTGNKAELMERLEKFRSKSRK